MTYKSKLQQLLASLPPKQQGEIWSDEQRLAIHHSGENIIISAGAGSGKTAVLTERIIHKILDGNSLQDMIVLTFTNDAATEMKERIRKKLKQTIEKDKTNEHLKKELDMLDSAHVETFDAFFLSIVKQYHYLINVPKKLSIGDQKYLEMICDKVMDETFEELASSDNNFVKLLSERSIKNSNTLKDHSLNFYKKMDSQVDIDAYLDSYISNQSSKEYISNLETSYLNYLSLQDTLLRDSFNNILYDDSLDRYHEFITDLFNKLPDKGTLRSYDDYKVFESITPEKLTPGINQKDELDKVFTGKYKKVKDILGNIQTYISYESFSDLVNEHLKTFDTQKVFITILKKFYKKLMNYKNLHAIYDFGDIARFAIKIVKENKFVQEELQDKVEVLVDEYQDTSVIQEELINLIGRDNVYMVGDIKQSIYRFRKASPELFRDKYLNYKNLNGGYAIDLVNNFRSRNEVLSNINKLFIPLMSKEYGGVDYEPDHLLKFGLKSYNDAISLDSYDMNFITYESNDDKKSEEKVKIPNYDEITEATIIAESIKSNLKNNIQVFDNSSPTKLRPATYSDFTILVKERKKYEIFKTVFNNYQIPLFDDNGNGFLDNRAIQFITHVLRLAYCYKDTEYHETYYRRSVLGILRSFIYKDESTDFLSSKLAIEGNKFEDLYPEIYNKVKTISDLINISPIDEIIKSIVTTFNVCEHLTKLDNINQAFTSIDFFEQTAKNLSSTGVTTKEFIEYVDYLKEKNKDISFEVTSSKNINAVRIMTIHKSKGLEFPFCYFTNLKNKFNKKEIETSYLFNNNIGIIVPYFEEEQGLIDSPFLEVAKAEFTKDSISEYIRLFYVALTRAREKMWFVLPQHEDPESFKYKSKISFENLYEMIMSVYYKWENYVTIADISNFDYDIYKSKKNTTNKLIGKNKKHLLKQELKTPIINEEISKVASAKISGLIDASTSFNLKHGTALHEYLESHLVKDGFIKDDSLLNNDNEYLKKFYDYFNDNTFIHKDEIINEYHELEFYYNNTSGIIDLLLETKDTFYIIDYKMSETNKQAYFKQLSVYEEYIKTKTNKPIKKYLYSIFKSQFMEV